MSQPYDGCIDSGKAPKARRPECDHCSFKWKSGFVSIDLGVSIPVGGYEMTNYAKVGVRTSIGGGYYFKKHFGLGMSIVHMYNPIDAHALTYAFGAYLETRFTDWNYESNGHHVIAALIDFNLRFPFCKWQINVIPQIGPAIFVSSMVRTSAYDGAEEVNAEWMVDRYSKVHIRPVVGMTIATEYRISKLSSISLSANYLYGLFYLDYWTDDYLTYSNTRMGIGMGGDWDSPGVSHLGIQIKYILNICLR